MVLSANVCTDQPDYLPGEMAHIVATDFAIGETVQFQVLHNDGTPNTGAGHEPWQVTDGVRGDFNNDGIMDGDLDGVADGNILTTWYVNPDDSAGSSFDLTAQGISSGRSAVITFTDGNPAVDLQQFENLAGNWANGQANTNQAKYLEGDVVPYWLEASNLTVGTTYGVRINLDYYQSATDAGGFVYLDTYNDSISVPQNSNDGTGGPLPAFTADNTFTFTDPLYANPGLTFYVYNANITSVTYSTSANGLMRFADVRFTALAANENDGEATVNIYWGQKLALPNEVITSANADANSKGAAGFTGGSLQTKIQGTGAAGATWISPSNAVQLMPGVVVQGAISGYKWNDLDGDGVWDANEPGLSGWTIQLYKDDGDNVFDPGDSLVGTRTTADGSTDANGDGTISAADLGFYKFAPVLRGTYFVREATPLPAGWSQTSPAGNLYGPLTISEVTSSYTNKNFGNYQKAGISGTKYTDITGNGITADDTGLGGVTIKLFTDADNDGVLTGADGAAVATTTTAANGTYSFGSLNAGRYFVQETIPAGYVQTAPASPGYYTILITSGLSATGKDFANFQKAKITGTKYTDITGNGVSADDTGLGGVTINLYQGNSANGALIATTTTAADGSYSFNDLAPGTYFVQETVPAGYVQTGGNSGYAVTIGGAGVTSGGTSTGNNFANFQKGSIRGKKFTDITGNGVTGGDTALGGVTIRLFADTDNDGVLTGADGAAVANTTTAADGTYSFGSLNAGRYFVQEVVPAGYQQTGPGAPGYYTVVITSGLNATDKDFANFQKAKITGTKYTDITGNSFSADDTGLGGVTINLYQGTDATGPLVASTTTAGDGSYSFNDLAIGTYFVQETVPGGYVQTGGNAGYVVTIGSNGVTSGGTSSGNNFANFAKGGISGRKYTDITGNGITGDDTGLGGVTIQLFADADNDGVLTGADGAAIASTTTAANGTYSFGSLSAGRYFVQELVPAGYQQTGPGAPGYHTVVITSGLEVTDKDFANFKKAKITGTKYTDITGNSFSADDTGLGGVTINLYQGTDANGPLVASTNTAADGSYSFNDLAIGTYFVQETVPGGYVQTGGNAGYVVTIGGNGVTSGGTSTSNNFDNFQKGSISGTKFTDVTGNGITGDDTGLGNVTIELFRDTDNDGVLTGADGAAVASTTTAANGTYSFGALTAGRYFVQEVVPTAYQQTGPGAPGYYTVVITSGVNATDKNFANFKKARITGSKYTDITGNSFSADDTGLGGVTINLYQGTDSNGPLVASTTTAGDGSYSFNDLAIGTYFVQETVPGGYVQTGGNAGYVVIVGGNGVQSGGAADNNNFDNFKKVKITGTKYTDITGNSFSADDTGLGGVTINLYSGNSANGAPIATTTTAADGTYTFENLAPGTYFVQEDVSAGYVQTGGNAGYIVVVGANGVQSGGTSANNNFDNFQKAKITGTKYTDVTGNSFSNDDTGLGGVTINLYSGNSANGVPIDTTTTAADGSYNFENLAPGTYFVQETLPAGYLQTGGNAGYVVVVGGNGVQSGGTSSGNNFDNFKKGRISGKKFTDLTGNSFSADDTPLGGVTINLYAGTSANGASIATTTTAADGSYSFENLGPGTYFVQETVPNGYVQTGGNAGYIVVATSGFDAKNKDFDNKKRQIIILGPDKGNKSVPIIRIVDKDTGHILKEFSAYESTFLGGVRIATGDINGDGIDEIIVAPGQGRAPEVKIFSQDGTLLDSFMAYDPSYVGGVEVAVGDVDGDGKPDIVTTPTNGRTEVRLFKNQLANINSPWDTAFTDTPDLKFNVFPSSFLGGADVAIADVGRFNNGATVNALAQDGKGEIIVGNGPGMRSTILVYDVTGTPKVVDTILPFSDSFNGGITLSAARINNDVIPDFIVASGNQGGSKVEVWNGLTNDNPDQLLFPPGFFAFEDQSTKNAPVHATAFDTDGDPLGRADVIAVVQGTNGSSNQIRYFKTDGTPLGQHTGFVGPWNIASISKVDPALPLDGPAADQVFAQIGQNPAPKPKKPKKPKKH
jgi:hypothetical protein